MFAKKKLETLSSKELVIYNKDFSMLEATTFLRDPLDFLNKTSYEFLKKDKKTILYKVRIDGKVVVIKRFLGAHFFQDLFQRSKALRSWENAKYLTDLGLLTPKPLAAVRKRKTFFSHTEEFYVMDYVEGITLSNLFFLHKEDQVLRETVVKEMKKIFSLLKRNRIVHGDMKGNNFLFSKSKVLILDLEHIHRDGCPKQYEKKFKKDYLRFLKNWEKNPELLSFFKRHLSDI